MSVGITTTTLVISSQGDEGEYELQHRPEVVCIERTLIFWLFGSLKQPAYKFNSQGWDTHHEITTNERNLRRLGKGNSCSTL